MWVGVVIPHGGVAKRRGGAQGDPEGEYRAPPSEAARPQHGRPAHTGGCTVRTLRWVSTLQPSEIPAEGAERPSSAIPAGAPPLTISAIRPHATRARHPLLASSTIPLRWVSSLHPSEIPGEGAERPSTWISEGGRVGGGGGARQAEGGHERLRGLSRKTHNRAVRHGACSPQTTANAGVRRRRGEHARAVVRDDGGGSAYRHRHRDRDRDRDREKKNRLGRG
jgi:hypothetical protein